MSRGALALVISSVVLGSTGVVAAGTFGGWRYTAPPDFTTEAHDDHVALTKAADGSFCSIAIFEVRPLQHPAAVERAYEWYNTVTHAFTAHVTHRGSLVTKLGTVATTTATLVDGDNQRYAASHFIVTPPGMIGSVLVIADTHASLARCGDAAVGVVRSLELDRAHFIDPEARVETPQGRWTSLGATNREYTFASDGTYRFHSETGRDVLRVVDETGTYTVLDDQLTLAPRTSTSATVSHGVAKATAQKLAATTYHWSKRYVPESNEWFLVLTSGKATSDFSDRAKAPWKLAHGEPGA